MIYDVGLLAWGLVLEGGWGLGFRVLVGVWYLGCKVLVGVWGLGCSV